MGSETTTVTTEGTELVMERVFNAPRELVWAAFTEAEHVRRWWGPKGTTVTVVEMDVRPGGTWRYVTHGPDGQDAPFKGEYLEVVPNERIVRTFVFDVEPFNDHSAVETLTFEDLGGRTKVSTRSRYSSREALDGALAAGMEQGATETYDRLADILTELTTGLN
ncbi:Uncharacterized conserved protein YndB, AHSA1/START domain [Thermomonospora echinospora]|uniref:Uncharacterized conserved protein YndB, AHSA1/START domain n=1 Tax=Thermomonospora echinospora TaxID=1992 RepID=A0A1H6CUY7_9ACTN|nr:SRPBCC family protein [Thermomonospora echinospora]SEG76899.1 Uncharacterized conserved protein YndB, AHSA1/START domain [Thermomonospora echinospora]